MPADLLHTLGFVDTAYTAWSSAPPGDERRAAFFDEAGLQPSMIHLAQLMQLHALPGMDTQAVDACLGEHAPLPSAAPRLIEAASDLLDLHDELALLTPAVLPELVSARVAVGRLADAWWATGQDDLDGLDSAYLAWRTAAFELASMLDELMPEWTLTACSILMADSATVEAFEDTLIGLMPNSDARLFEDADLVIEALAGRRTPSLDSGAFPMDGSVTSAGWDVIAEIEESHPVRLSPEQINATLWLFANQPADAASGLA